MGILHFATSSRKTPIIRSAFTCSILMFEWSFCCSMRVQPVVSVHSCICINVDIYLFIYLFISVNQRENMLSRYMLTVKLYITYTCLYNVDPLKPHFYIVKLGLKGIYIISALKHRLWVPVRTASARWF